MAGKKYRLYFIGYNFRDAYLDGHDEFIDLVVPTIEGGCLMKMVFQYRGYTPAGYHFIGIAEYNTQILGTKRDTR